MIYIIYGYNIEYHTLFNFTANVYQNINKEKNHRIRCEYTDHRERLNIKTHIQELQ